MEKFLYSAAKGGASPSCTGADLLRFLESRLKSYHALSESLAQCRTAFIANNIEGIMTGVDVQSALCEDIQRSERGIQAFCQRHAAQGRSLVDALNDNELSKAQDLMRQSVTIVGQISQQNQIYANMVRKAAQHNAVLRNLYQSGIVYSDPRLNEPRGGLCGTSEARYG